MPDTAQTPKPAVAIPDHELLRPIGRGSYGEVWLARSVLGEYRAVKIIRRDSFDRDRRVERELEGIQKFEPISRSQENLVHILHVGRFAEGFFYVMELADDSNAEGGVRSAESSVAVSGKVGKRESESGVSSPAHSPTFSPATYAPRTLRSEVQRRGRLPVTDCLDTALKLTDALAHLHGHGLVHRDVKPSNIIFVRGQPKLADIGLVATADSSLSCVGTEGFLPPEGPGKPQADLYALGKVLYEISTGRDRHNFPELPTMLRDDPQRRALEEFNEVVLQACDPDVRRRYSTARAMHGELELLRAGKSLQQVRRRERRWAGARKVAVAVALAGVLLAALSSWWTPPREANRHLPVRLAVEDARFWRVPFMPRQFDFSPDGERIVFSGVNLISIWEAKTRITRRLELVGIGDWKPAGGGTTALARWAPDSRRFVFQAQKRVGGTVDDPILVYTFFVVNADMGEARQIGPDLLEAERANDLCWRPDGEAVTYVVSPRRLMTLTLSGERTAWKDSALSGTGAIRLGDYSPDGAWLLVSSGSPGPDSSDDRDVWAMPHLGGPSQRLTQGAGMDAYPTWGPDRETVYYVSDAGRSRGETWGLWRVQVDRKPMQPKGPAAEVFVRNGSKILHPRFVAGGRTLAYAVMEPKTDIWVGESDALEKGTIAVRGKDPVLSPDGQTIYFVGERPDQHGVFAISRHGDKSSLRKITDLTPLITGFTSSGLNLSPDGQWLALFADDGKQPGIFVTTTNGGEPRLMHAAMKPNAPLPVWSPNGEWLAFVVDQQLVRVSRNSQARETLATLPRWQGWSVRWSRDGTRLAAFGSTVADLKSEDSSVYVVAVADKTLRKITPDSENQWKEGLEWHPSGEYLTYMIYGPERFSAQIRRTYVDGRPTELMIQQPDHWDYLGVWAPDGRRFFFVSSANKRGEKDIHLYDAQTTQIAHGLWGGGMAALPRWSRDGRTAVWAVGETQRYFEVIENFQ
ncbi:MAG: serine/threonine-protein kinase [Verrucomicrobia bacterium]|nr:serine/threonine-protein kinase [Verrucomicrobiota bacterium]